MLKAAPNEYGNRDEEGRSMRDVLKITWHGIHELEIFPGLPDTGGQNIYVQNMAEHIHDRGGFRVRILNRGGYVHPYTERMRSLSSCAAFRR